MLFKRMVCYSLFKFEILSKLQTNDLEQAGEVRNLLSTPEDTDNFVSSESPLAVTSLLAPFKVTLFFRLALTFVALTCAFPSM